MSLDISVPFSLLGLMPKTVMPCFLVSSRASCSVMMCAAPLEALYARLVVMGMCDALLTMFNTVPRDFTSAGSAHWVILKMPLAFTSNT